MLNPIFKPTELDLALQHDPAADAAQRELTVAATKPPAPSGNELVDKTAEGHAPMSLDGEPSRQGQIETAAASLAGGMIAAEGRPVTAAEAVQKVRDVMDELLTNKQ